MGYTPMGNMPRGGGNQMGGFNGQYYPQNQLSMNMGMAQGGAGRRRGGIQAKMRQANQAAMMA